MSVERDRVVADAARPSADGQDDRVAVLEEELRRAREHLALFAGQVSHDLRTPLTAILANAEMLGAEPAVAASEDLSWMVGGIGRAARRLNAMIDTMVEYARAGGVPDLAVTDLAEVFAAALEDLAPMVEASRASITVGALPTLPADRAQLYAVASNLLSNALAYSRPDVPPVIEVRAAGRGGSWRVSVVDNGRGIRPDLREAVFVLFAQGDRGAGGAGVGLAVVRRIVEAHGGRVGLEPVARGDSDGSGTVAWFELPA